RRRAPPPRATSPTSAFTLRIALVTGSCAPVRGLVATKCPMPWASGGLPVAMVVQMIGLRSGLLLGSRPEGPPAHSRLKFRSAPSSISWSTTLGSMPSSPSTMTRPRSSRRLQPPARTSVKAMTRSGRRIASAIADDQLEHRHLARHADAEREAVETGTPVHVETVRTVAEEPVIGPARACEYGPIEPEADEAELAPVRVTRQRQVDVALGHVAEAERVVQK